MDAREFVEVAVCALVTNPEGVSVARQADEMGVLISVRVDPNDMGLVIGRGGEIINAIRTIARAIGMKDRQRVSLRVEEPDGALPRAARPRRTVDEVVGSL
jgi:hypothetical protein